MIKKILIRLIKVYQKYISPMKPPSCRFYPMCSQYTIDAISKYGIIKGISMALRRLVKCHPFNPGGYDPVK